MGILDVPGLNKSSADARYVATNTLRRRDCPGFSNLPALMVTPPTATLSAANPQTSGTLSAALGSTGQTSLPTTMSVPLVGTQLLVGSNTANVETVTTTAASNGTSVSVTATTKVHASGETVLLNPVIPMSQPGAFTYTGPTPTRLGFSQDGVNAYYGQGLYTITSPSPWAAEFDLRTSTGKFEVVFRGTGQAAGGVRVLVNGQYASQGFTFGSPTADGNTYRGFVSLPAAGRYRIRLELDLGAQFYGVAVSLQDSVSATARANRRFIVVGDSFTEPTVQDSTPHIGNDGYVQRLNYLLGPAVDCWSAGSGGTGYLKVNGSRPKYRDRLAADVLAYNPDAVFFTGGLNDYSAFTAAQIGAEALLCFQQTRAALPNAPIYVVAPFWRSGYQSFPSNFLAMSDAIKAAAASVSNCLWIDLTRLPVVLPRFTAGTLSSDVATANTATSITTTANIPIGAYFQLGTGTNAEVRKCAGVTGSGPYVVSFGGGLGSGGGSVLTSTHVTGEAVLPCGPNIYTGSGYQGAIVGDGNADLFCGNDHTHPTALGHDNIAVNMFAGLMSLLPA